MKLPDRPWRHRNGLSRLLDLLGSSQGDIRFVGGCVRDSLLGLEVNDIDLATRLQPKEVLNRLGEAGIKAVPTGLAHGTITAILSGRPIEITTLRRDVSTDGRHAEIAFTDDWREDAARRDFTINALSADPASSALFDYFSGLADLGTRTVRFIGDPLTRISEDHLRILRFFRFHARFGEGRPDEASLAACTARANDLMALSRERIADELLKLLALPDPSPTLALMIEKGVLKPVLPEIRDSSRLEALIAGERAACLDPDPLRRLAALLPVDPETSAAVAARLRLSKRASKRLVSASMQALDRPDLLAWRIGAEEAVDRLLLHGEKGANLDQLRQWERPKLPIGGGDLVAMGLKAGPLVARTLKQIEEDWARSGFTDDRETLLHRARQQVDQLLRESQ